MFFAVFACWFFRFFWRKSRERTLTTHRRVRRVEPMRRLVVLAAAVILAAAAVSADAAAPAFRYGVAAGEITAISATLWTHARASGAVTVRVSRNRSLAASRLATANAAPSDDLTLSIVVRGSTLARATTTNSLRAGREAVAAPSSPRRDRPRA